MGKASLRAVLFDTDGTLYLQTPLRLLMILELCMLPIALRSFHRVGSVVRTLKHFRKSREQLRHRMHSNASLAELQYVEAAKRAGVTQADVESVVNDWMYQRPLKYIRYLKRPGLDNFFSFVESRGLRTGVFSDYPAGEKLEALGLHKRVSLTLCATDPEINALKPHPRGFLRACELWDLDPGEVLYIGDRPEVDAVGAASAGMPCAILGGVLKYRRYPERVSPRLMVFTSFESLQYGLN